MYITRIAPSPTGDMHIGTARTAYFNWLAARASGGKFLLRIDDTDQKRNDEAYVKVILDTMEWLGLDYDGVVYQSHRFEVYREAAQQLVDAGWAEEKDGAVLFRSREGELPAPWMDSIKGEIKITADNVARMDGMVCIKSDGSPAYNFCSVVDDIAFGVNFVIRGSDHITNTSKQVQIWRLLAPGALPKFAHLGLICIKGKPLSKRDGASSMLHYMRAGYDPDAMLNFLARLGWGPTKDDKSTSMLPRDRMLELFLTEGQMNNRPAGFDLNKLESFDRKYKAQKGVWRTGEKLLGG
jgi:nondiscriminating glutamyl-tRNA synthetase